MAKEKPADCTCDYPAVMVRNYVGHPPTCGAYDRLALECFRPHYAKEGKELLRVENGVFYLRAQSPEIDDAFSQLDAKIESKQATAADFNLLIEAVSKSTLERVNRHVRPKQIGSGGMSPGDRTAPKRQGVNNPPKQGRGRRYAAGTPAKERQNEQQRRRVAQEGQQAPPAAENERLRSTPPPPQPAPKASKPAKAAAVDQAAPTSAPVTGPTPSPDPNTNSATQTPPPDGSGWLHYQLSFDKAGYSNDLRHMLDQAGIKEGQDWRFGDRPGQPDFMRFSLRPGIRLTAEMADWLLKVGDARPQDYDPRSIFPLVETAFPRELIQEVADTWFRPNGSPKTRAMTQAMVADTMKRYQLGLREAARLFEQAMLFYKPEHVVGGPAAYWGLIDRIEQGGTWFPKDAAHLLEQGNLTEGAEGDETRTYTVSGPARQLDMFEKFLHWIGYCCSAGHSGAAKFAVDGDGGASLKFEGLATERDKDELEQITGGQQTDAKVEAVFGLE